MGEIVLALVLGLVVGYILGLITEMDNNDEQD